MVFCQAGSMTAVLMNRLIKIDAVHNIRHLGGYRTLDGMETRDEPIRAASLHNLTDAGMERLVELNVRTIIDFRSEEEREHMPTRTLEHFGIVNVSAPVFGRNASPTALAQDFQGYAKVYPRFLETGRDAYRKLFDVIGESEGRVIFHCAAGKDRTGVAAALILGLAGVSDQDIVEDYSHSAELLKDAFKDWKPANPDTPPIDPELRARLLASDPADMQSTLVHLNEKWGSAQGYLEDLGFTAGDLAHLKRKLVA